MQHPNESKWQQDSTRNDETMTDIGGRSQADENNDLPSQETIGALLEIVAPGSTRPTVRPLAGSYSNLTHLVQALGTDRSPVRMVVRRYVHGDRAQKARLEFRTLAFLQAHAIPAPAPLYLDEDGAVLGRPGIVTGFVSGEQLMLPSEHPSSPLEWARLLATMLAQIHSIPCHDARDFLLDANAEATWFLRSGVIPGYMRAHPDGQVVWQTVHDLLPTIQRVEPALVHLDYWRGNLLWKQGQIAAVVDWEEAAYGDPAVDVAYCRMEMVIMGMTRES